MVATGIVFLLWDFYSYAKQKLNESMGMIWGFVSLALIITGAVPALSGEVSEWLLICLFIICLMSVLTMKNQELAMQVSLLNQENEKILHQLGILKDEKKDTVRH